MPKKDFYCLLPAQLLGTQCETCLRKEKVEERYRCTALKNFYFVGYKAPKVCLSFQDSPQVIEKELEQLRDYLLAKDTNEPEDTVAVKRAESEIEAMRKGRKVSSMEAEAMFYEESHKDGCGGGGEKQDRTHKLFPESRMKDNRYVPPWGSEGGTYDGGQRYIKKKK